MLCCLHLIIHRSDEANMKSLLENIMEKMKRDIKAGNLSFPGVKERVEPVAGSLNTLKQPWLGCDFGQQAVDDQCSKFMGYPFMLTS